MTTRFNYDGTDLIAEYSSRALLRRYVHGPGSDEPVLQYEGATLTNKRYLTSDERGSVIAVTDSSGTATTINTYDEYGKPAPSNASVAGGGRFQYTGQTWLPELELYYYKARVYNPALGRFMQTDPIGYGDGMNVYNYVGSDPVNFTDPMGLTEADRSGGSVCIVESWFIGYYTLDGMFLGRKADSEWTEEHCSSATDFGLGVGGSGGAGPSENPGEGIVVLGSQLVSDDPQYLICKGPAYVLAGNPRLKYGNPGGMGRPVGNLSAAVIPRQWDPNAPSSGKTSPLLRTLSINIGGYTSQGQQFNNIDDVMAHKKLGNTRKAQDIIMARHPGVVVVELVDGFHEGLINITIEIPIHSGLGCSSGTSFTGTG